MKIFIGYDDREAVVFHVCAQSIIENSSELIEIVPLCLNHLTGYDEGHLDGSNSFTYSRFLVPYLAGYSGLALFIDGDMVVTEDLSNLFSVGRSDLSKAAWVVKHEPYNTNHPVKYFGNPNHNYPRKNWSSVVLFNCSHPSLRCLTPDYVSKSSGKHLHRFEFLNDSEIGELPKKWNVLVGESDNYPSSGLYHYTIGAPCFKNYANCEKSEEWLARFRAMLAGVDWDID